MIGTKYTPGLLADLAKTPHVRSMETPTTPNRQWVSFIAKRYTELTSTVEFKSGIDTITSFYENENETSGDPWLVIVEPD